MSGLTDLREQSLALFDLAPHPLFILDDKGCIEQANHAAAEFFGQSRESLFRQTLQSFVVVEDQIDFLTEIGQLLAQEAPSSFTLRLLNGDGAPTQVSLAARVLKGCRRLGVRYCVVSVNPNPEPTDSSILSPNEELSLLRSANTTFASVREPDELIRLVVNETIKLCGADGGNVWLVHPNDTSPIECLFVDAEGNGHYTELPQTLRALADETLSLQRALAVDDVKATLRWNGQFEPALRVQSCLSVPLMARQEVIGVIQLYSSNTDGFTPRDLAVAQVVAFSAALAIQNVRLFRSAINEAVNKERNRLSQHIHDTFSQSLYATNLIADNVLEIWRKNPEDGIRALEELRTDVRDMIAAHRLSMVELRSQDTGYIAIVDAVFDLVDEFRKHSGIPVDIDAVNTDSVDQDICVVFYRVCQETLTNVQKHAKATKVHIKLRCAADAITMIIEDDGRGFNIAERPYGHFGLEIMRDRAEEIGAQLIINSEYNTGTTVLLRWMNPKLLAANGQHMDISSEFESFRSLDLA